MVACEKESQSREAIIIKTGKADYLVNSKIDITITNRLGKRVNHFKCDNVDIAPAKILKLDNENWIENEYPVLCTHMGPEGYIGTLEASETIHDTVWLFNEMGYYKLRYCFVSDNDTLDYESNPFSISGLEL